VLDLISYMGLPWHRREIVDVQRWLRRQSWLHRR
jgi:hypothetical protein